MDEDDLGFRERKDEIDNEIERCKKTNKQAFTDLMEARSDINDNLNKKREIERKIEEENKKFKKIEEELIKKISDLNRKIAEAKYEKKSLELDKKDNLSIQKITNYQRELSNKVGDLKSDAENYQLQVTKTQNQINNFLSSLMDEYKYLASKKIKIEWLQDQIKSLTGDKLNERKKSMLEAHSQKQI